MKSFLFILIFSFLTCSGISQSISGYVYDSENQPIPFVNIYFKNTQNGTTTNTEGQYYYQFNNASSAVLTFDVVISSIGYKTKELQIIIDKNEDVVRNFWLETDNIQLDELVIKAKKRDPAYGIINQAIQQKKKWKSQYNSSSCDVYIKAKEIISEKEKRRRKRLEEEQKIQAENETTFDVETLHKEKQKQEVLKIAQEMNMAEIILTKHFEAPNNIKEIRTAYKKLGNTYALYSLTTAHSDFNFYQNLLHNEKLCDLPLISPLHTTAVITYKFKLEETTFEDDIMLYKIKVTPRKKGNATWNGYIWIKDKSFHIHKLDLTLQNGGLILYNEFRIEQAYQFIEDSIQVIKNQKFTYYSKTKRNHFNGETTLNYSNYKINPTFEKRFFKNEVAVTTQEAYQRDSSYWDKIRPEPLTQKEQRYQFIKDSIYAVTHSKRYLDSIDSVYNKITFMDVLWDGINITNRQKKQRIGFSSLISMIDIFEIASLRYGPGMDYFKKWENEKFLFGYGNANIGLRNGDLKGMLWLNYRYDPMHLGHFYFYAGNQFEMLVENDALTNLFVRDNWIELNETYVGWSREIVNGVYFYSRLAFEERKPIDGYKFGTITEDWFGGNQVSTFQMYQSLSMQNRIAYTPFQKYMTEPYRKVVLGSRWPTFALYYEKGFDNLLGSDINFDYVEGSISQKFKLGTMGTSSYIAKYGKFTNTQDLRYADYIIFPRGDKYFFASLMQSMQIQDTTLTVTDAFFQMHYTHHFNGAIVNFIPLVKKLGLHLAAGGSALMIPESNYSYVEAFAGIERTFKAQRARYRIGVFAVAAESNYTNIKPRIKFAINRYRLQDNSWGY
ncbi:MAG: DUF5686 and carboxypeptidase regulatory-like domain-containing protein [Flavobacteriales bacterium]|jgi:hypothetical protein|nr:DUF5686 and carboxypeptidase regulatory-like domain-containing protein [Flavobacteriales bacterium]